jgi:hypothetical protein
MAAKFRQFLQIVPISSDGPATIPKAATFESPEFEINS